MQGNRLKEFDASSFEGAPRLLLLDLSHNELQHAEWGRPSWGSSWGPSARGLEEQPTAAASGRRVVVRRGPQQTGGVAARALEAGPGESDLLAAASSFMPGLEVLDLSHNQLRNLEDAGVANLPWLVELKVTAIIT